MSGGTGGLAPSSLDVERVSEESGGDVHCAFCSDVVQEDAIFCPGCFCRFHAGVACVGVDREVISCLLREKSGALSIIVTDVGLEIAQ